MLVTVSVVMDSHLYFELFKSLGKQDGEDLTGVEFGAAFKLLILCVDDLDKDISILESFLAKICNMFDITPDSCILAMQRFLNSIRIIVEKDVDILKPRQSGTLLRVFQLFAKHALAHLLMNVAKHQSLLSLFNVLAEILMLIEAKDVIFSLLSELTENRAFGVLISSE